MALKESEINFIQAKVNEINYALFSSELEAEFCLFNNVIKTIKTDRQGNIWFFTACKAKSVESLQGEFFACLKYYQKGKDFWLHLSGKASIENIKDIVGAEINCVRVVLIKYKIEKAEYFEYNKAEEISFTKMFKKYLGDIFFQNSHRLYDFSSTKHVERA